MTAGEAARLVLGEGATWDAALPADWVNKVVEQCGEHVTHATIYREFVWAYDGRWRIGGRPCPLTTKGNAVLRTINAHLGSNWPLTLRPADRTAEGLQMIAAEIFDTFWCGNISDARERVALLAREDVGAGIYVAAVLTATFGEGERRSDWLRAMEGLL